MNTIFDAGGRKALRLVFDLDEIGGEGGLDGDYAGNFRERILDEPGAGSAPHAADVEKQFFGGAFDGSGDRGAGGLGVRDQAEGEAAFKEFSIAEILTGLETFVEDQVDVHAAEAAEETILLADMLLIRTAAARQPT